MSTEKEHLAAVIALLGGSARGAYGLGDLKKLGNLPTSYNEVMVMERVPDGPDRRGSLSEVRQWRILIRSVGQVYGNAQEMRARASALHGSTLTVGGETFYPRRSATDDPIAPDSGWWSGTSEFTH